MDKGNPVGALQLSVRLREADPLFIKPQADGLASAYLAGHDALDPFASPLYARLEGLAHIIREAA
jgi:hypothetical protein